MEASAILEYFSPLYEWLIKTNNENGVEIGWDLSYGNYNSHKKFNLLFLKANCFSDFHRVFSCYGKESVTLNVNFTILIGNKTHFQTSKEIVKKFIVEENSLGLKTLLWRRI